jgi:hypothetical protein
VRLWTFNDLGKCLPINEAYKEAVTGKNQGGVLVNGETFYLIYIQVILCSVGFIGFIIFISFISFA